MFLIYTGSAGRLCLTATINLKSRGIPGGKANILGGRSIDHSKHKAAYVHVPYSERFPRYRYFSVSSKTVNKKEKLRIICNNGIYCSNYKVSRIYLVVIEVVVVVVVVVALEGGDSSSSIRRW
jgi:hypothetical protein